MAEVSPTPNVINQRDFEAGMKLLDTIYAITMVLGFRDLALGLYDFFFHHISFWSGETFEWLSIPLVLIALSIITFGLRFFWGVVNVRRYVDRIHWSGREISALVIKFHVGVLLMQGFLFYFLGKIYTELVDYVAVSGPRPSLRSIDSFIICSIALLAVNAIWLRIL